MFNPILIHEFLSLSAKRKPDKTAIVCEGERLTYKEFDESSDILALSLIDNGLIRHDRVIIFLDNCIELAIAVFGVLKAGGVFVCLSASAKSERLKYTIRDSDAKFVIAGTNNMQTVEKAFSCSAAEPVCKIVWIGSSALISKAVTNYSLKWDDLLNGHILKGHNTGLNGGGAAGKLKERKSQIIDYDLATLVYTSGSTGEPKGVMSSHSNMLAVSRSVIHYLENTQNDIILSVLPLSFVYGLYQLVAAVIVGATLVLETSFTFPNKIIHTIQQENVTGFPIIPTIAALILKLHGLEKLSLGSLRYITNAGAALPVEHVRKLRILFPHVKIYSMYGCAECLRVSYLSPDEIDVRPSSVGKAIPNCEVFIVDEFDRPVNPGEIGELVVRGSHVMRGYWKSPELTQKIFSSGIMQGEILLHTGDYFKQDSEGYLYFVCRKDDMIKTSGKKVSPKEVENVLYCINGIMEASVIGVPDDILGQAVKAFVVLNDGTDLRKNDILRYCADRLERHMMPKYIEIIDRLPKTLNGKIDKLVLKQLV